MRKLIVAAGIIWLSGFIPVTDWYEGQRGACHVGYEQLTPLLPNGLVICGKPATKDELERK